MSRRHTGGAASGVSKERDVFLALGSNIKPEIHLRRATEELARRFRVLSISRIYESEPVGAPGSTPFLNAAIMIRTDLPVTELKFRCLRPIEDRLGRKRTEEPNAPRTIDIDIVLYGVLILEVPELGLEIPDPDILRHAHLALPLADLAPHFKHPTTGQTLRQIADLHGPTPGVLARDDLAPLGDVAVQTKTHLTRF